MGKGECQPHNSKIIKPILRKLKFKLPLEDYHASKICIRSDHMGGLHEYPVCGKAMFLSLLIFRFLQLTNESNGMSDLDH